jgi:hypothetical protein
MVLARIARYTRSISIGFRFSSIADPEYRLVLLNMVHLINLPSILNSFICKAPQLSVLPQAVQEVLFARHAKSLKSLHGFATGFSSGTAILPFFCGLENIEQLTTGPTWLPRSAISTSDIVRSLLEKSSGDLFPHLTSLYTPMVASHNVLFDVLVGSKLSSLRHLRVSSWDRNSLHEFLTRHGQKLTHLELKYSWTEETLANKQVQPRSNMQGLPTLLQLVGLCPRLEQLTLHDCHSFGIIARASESWTHPKLTTIRMGCSALEGTWTFPEHQTDPTSWCLSTHRTVRACTQILDQAKWRTSLPALQRFLVWPPTRTIVSNEEDVDDEDVDLVLKEKTGWQIIEDWNCMLKPQDLRIEVENPYPKFL